MNLGSSSTMKAELESELRTELKNEIESDLEALNAIKNNEMAEAKLEAETQPEANGDWLNYHGYGGADFVKLDTEADAENEAEG